MSNYGSEEQIGLGRGWGQKRSECSCARQQRDPGGEGNVLLLDSITMNIPAVILYYSPAKCYHQGNWLNGTQALPVISNNKHIYLKLSPESS